MKLKNKEFSLKSKISFLFDFLFEISQKFKKIKNRNNYYIVLKKHIITK